MKLVSFLRFTFLSLLELNVYTAFKNYHIVNTYYKFKSFIGQICKILLDIFPFKLNFITITREKYERIFIISKIDLRIYRSKA